MLKQLGICLVILYCVLDNVSASQKKGICIGHGTKNYHCNDTNVFQTLAWWYDWVLNESEHHGKHCTNKPKGEYVPMYWGHSSLKNNLPSGTQHVLAFNEPDHKKQSNMTPQKVAELWPELEKKAGNRKIISPAIGGCGNAQKCINWFTEFFQHCKNCRVDALAVHTYSCNAEGVFNSLKKIAHHFGKNLWLTEFACANGKTVDQQISFMSKILPLLEGASFIEKYAWFINRMAQNSSFINTSVDLLEFTSSKLTKLGQYYDSHHNPK